MKLTVFAATGGIGGQILEQAVAAGHDVTAVVRDPRKLAGTRDGVRVVTADLAIPEPLTGKYRTALGQNVRRGLFISRADVAHAMLAALNQPATVKQTLGIAY
jgi:uncharacterized protein YbjT (DUF2867 family)